MKKDIEWLKEEIDKRIETHKEFMNHTFETDFTRMNARTVIGTYEYVKELIDQLDEPEVLSTDWIDKKRLINRVENYIPLHDKTVGDVINGILEIIKQLPELEVLSPEWIDKNQHPYGGDYHVPSEKLEDILVPKESLGNSQELEKVQIPQFVADLLKEHRETEENEPEITFYGFIKLVTTKGFEDNRSKEGEFTRWITNKNEEILMHAWLAYPNVEVEEEQKYYVLDTEDIPMLVKTYDAVNRANTHLSVHEKGRNTEHYQLTEQEIKDYDPRFWPFAVKVEELEE